MLGDATDRRPDAPTPESEAVSGAASEAAARAAKRRHAAALLATPGVAGVGVERDPSRADAFCLVVHVDPAAAPALPPALDGVPVRPLGSGPFRAGGG